MMARWSMGVLGLAVVGAALVLAGCPSTDSPEVSPRTAQQAKAPAVADADHSFQEALRMNWPRFRGPGGLGISAYTNVPSSWNGSTGEGVLWKSPVPLPGENSPVVWEDRVFLTGANEEKREVYCFAADSGEILWTGSVAGVPGSPSAAPEVSEDTGFAAPTAATDGERVYAIFANGDLISLDFDGQEVWVRNLGSPDNMYGHASSLAMYRNLLIVLFDQASAEDGLSRIMGLDAATGETAWETKRPVPNSWASPIIIDAGEREEIIACGSPWVIAYDPATGEELWRADCGEGDMGPSPTFSDGLVFAVNPYGHLAAIRPGGEGDVTASRVVWTSEDSLPDTCSLLSTGALVFSVATYGVLTCYDAKDGRMLWDKDFETSFNSSPSLAGDRAYLLSQEGVMFIIAAGREHKEFGRAELGEASNCSPAFTDGRIYIRGKTSLYCVGGA